MKTNTLAIVITILGAGSTIAQPPKETELRGEIPAGLQPAKLQPASGLDLAVGLGKNQVVRTPADSREAWLVRFPKLPNGQPRK